MKEKLDEKQRGEGVYKFYSRMNNKRGGIGRSCNTLYEAEISVSLWYITLYTAG